MHTSTHLSLTPLFLLTAKKNNTQTAPFLIDFLLSKQKRNKPADHLHPFLSLSLVTCKRGRRNSPFDLLVSRQISPHTPSCPPILLPEETSKQHHHRRRSAAAQPPPFCRRHHPPYHVERASPRKNSMPSVLLPNSTSTYTHIPTINCPPLLRVLLLDVSSPSHSPRRTPKQPHTLVLLVSPTTSSPLTTLPCC